MMEIQLDIDHLDAEEYFSNMIFVWFNRITLRRA